MNTLTFFRSIFNEIVECVCPQYTNGLKAPVDCVIFNVVDYYDFK